ncbi:AAA family ATPase [Brevundimonas sp.]|uniref:AAA family ATPase n=1 Tax=Brevundimonas sp. TaxID=1871086 RepID=UPI0035660AB7
MQIIQKTNGPLFTVIPSQRGPFPIVNTAYFLVRDNWDDHGFKTQYNLFRSKDQQRLGDVKILKRGQAETSLGILPDGLLTALPPDYCSLGQSLDYYERLAELDRAERDAILGALRDALLDPDHASSFQAERGWSISVRRDLQDFERLATVLLTKDFSSLVGMSLQMQFLPAGWTSPLHLDFDAPSENFAGTRARGGSSNRHKLPRRVAVLTGQNGSGKSTLLARMARVLHASPTDRRSSRLQDLGRVEPPGVGFTRILTVSFSAFDAFEVPGVDAAERRQIASEMRAGTGRYVFCGLRDIAAELEQELAQAEASKDSSAEETSGGGWGERRADSLLKTLDELAGEFARTIARINVDIDRQWLLSSAADLLLADPSFSDVTPRGLDTLLSSDPKSAFLKWSTGHKIVLFTLASLVAYAEPRSMVFLDEPEAHLHPPLLAALMHAIRYVLEDLDAFAVVATHAPVVVQETLSQHVFVVRREGRAFGLVAPAIETFGESIGTVTDEVFGLTTESTDYHTVLSGLWTRFRSVDAIEVLFEKGLSLQARAFLMTLAAREATQV